LDLLSPHESLIDEYLAQEIQRTAWHPFQTGAADICVISKAGLRGLVLARKVLVSDLEMPRAGTVIHANQEQNLIFFRQ
jgi:hypothetical protein